MGLQIGVHKVLFLRCIISYLTGYSVTCTKQNHRTAGLYLEPPVIYFREGEMTVQKPVLVKAHKAFALLCRDAQRQNIL